MRTTGYFITTPKEDAPAAIPGLIDPAVAAFDADRDTSRRYLLLASALLSVNRRAHSAESARRSESRCGLLAWELDRLVAYIEAHLADKITANDLASLINVSVGRLFLKFRISVGVTPHRYVARRRVEIVCRLLETTREPLSQVALAVGLCDQAHLCRVFRRSIGMSPSTWRRVMSPDSWPQTSAESICLLDGEQCKGGVDDA